MTKFDITTMWRRVGAALLVAVLIGAATPPAQAHHSFPATYDGDKTITVKGTVLQFMFRNPHSLLHVQSADESGKPVTWVVEWAASGSLGSQGIQGNTLRPGDKVVVTGNPARDEQSHRLNMRAIERPSDGWKWAGTFG